MVKVVIFGGRDFGNTYNIHDPEVLKERKKQYDFGMRLLDELHNEYTFTVVISGMARGADTIGYNWGKLNNIPVLEFHAQWNTYGKSAGFVRNTQMLEEGEPAMGIAFPGGNGTKMMCDLSRRCGVKVIEISY